MSSTIPQMEVADEMSEDVNDNLHMNFPCPDDSDDDGTFKAVCWLIRLGSLLESVKQSNLVT